MACYNCAYLNTLDKKEGNINGCLYYCSKCKKYVNGTDNGCENYSKDYSRKNYENNEIYNNGRHYHNGSDKPLSVYIILIIILIIMAIIANM